jgi:hypothetical protein
MSSLSRPAVLSADQQDEAFEMITAIRLRRLAGKELDCRLGRPPPALAGGVGAAAISAVVLRFLGLQ